MLCCPDLEVTIIYRSRSVLHSRDLCELNRNSKDPPLLRLFVECPGNPPFLSFFVENPLSELLCYTMKSPLPSLSEICRESPRKLLPEFYPLLTDSLSDTIEISAEWASLSEISQKFLFVLCFPALHRSSFRSPRFPCEKIDAETLNRQKTKLKSVHSPSCDHRRVISPHMSFHRISSLSLFVYFSSVIAPRTFILLPIGRRPRGVQ